MEPGWNWCGIIVLNTKVLFVWCNMHGFTGHKLCELTRIIKTKFNSTLAMEPNIAIQQYITIF